MIRCQGIGQPYTACTDDNVDSVNELVLIQKRCTKESQNYTSHFTKKTGIHSVYRTIR